MADFVRGLAEWRSPKPEGGGSGGVQGVQGSAAPHRVNAAVGSRGGQLGERNRSRGAQQNARIVYLPGYKLHNVVVPWPDDI